MSESPDERDGEAAAEETAESSAAAGQAVARLMRVLVEAAGRDPALRAALRQAGEWLLEVCEPPAESASPAARVEERIAAPEPPEPQVRMPLRLGTAQVVIPVRDDGAEPPVELPAEPPAERPGAAAEREPLRLPDLALLKRRVALKAECCRWAIERRRRKADRDDFEAWIKPRDQELVAAAKSLPGCYVWPLDPFVSLPADEALEHAAQCYENLQRAADLALAVREADPDGEMLAPAYALLAEAQSMVRALMRQLDLREDADQYDAFRWVRMRTEADQIYVDRYMKINDPADPGDAVRLEDSLERTRGAWEERRRAAAARARLFNRARYHARKLGDGPGIDNRRDWRVLCESVAELVDSGLPPSNAELRELLLPLVDQLPDDLGESPSFQRVLREVDRYVASRELDRPPQTPEPQDANVQRVRDLLRGRTVVLIGGERRGETAERLRRTFELEDLRWVSGREHQSTAEFEPAIARPETALVLLAIRWSSHSFEDVADMCHKHGKAFVRLPGGYGANQIAHQALQQASETLAAGRT